MSSQSKKIPDFIKKILEMIQNYSSVINWSEQGNELVILDLVKFSQNVLPQYFRHDKFESFVRQLNMYGFHKICRKKNNINFRNQNFERDGQNKLHNIKRRKKQYGDNKAEIYRRQEQINEIMSNKYSRNIRTLPPLIQNLIDYKNKSIQQLNKLKKTLDQLGKELNQRKSKTIKPVINLIKQLINITEQTEEKIDIETLKFKKDTKIESSVHQPIIPYPLVKSDIPQGIKQVKPSSNSNDSSKNTGSEGLAITSFCSFQSFQSVVQKYIAD